MTRNEYQEILNFKEERINYWEKYGCVLSDDGSRCEFVYPLMWGDMMRYIKQLNRTNAMNMYDYEQFDRDEEGNILLKDEIEMTSIDPYSDYDISR